LKGEHKLEVSGRTCSGKFVDLWKI